MDDRKIAVEIANWIAGIVGLIAIAVIPLGYYAISYKYTVGSLEAEAEINSRIFSGIINRNPEHWQYEKLRLEELLKRRPGSGEKESRRITDLNGQLVAESSDPITPPLISRSHALQDSGVVVGKIEISRSLSPIVINTGLIACLGVAIGLALFFTLKNLPFRAIIEAEDALRKSEEQYRSLFDNMLNGFAFCKVVHEGERPVDFIYLKVNKAFEALTGLDNVTGKRASEVIPGIHETDPLLLEKYGRVVMTGQPEAFEIYLNTLSAWLSISAYSPIKNHFVSIINVITDRKLAEDSLRESEERLRRFIEDAPAALAMFDRQMRYLKVSRRWLSDYKIGDRDVIGLSHYDVFPEIPERWKTIHKRAMEGEVIRADKERFDRADGSVQWLRWDVRPWRDRSRQIGGIMMLTEDITEVKRSEDQVREALLRQNEATRAGNVGLWEWDLATNKVYYSTEWKRQIGYEEDEISDAFEEWKSRVHPSDLEQTEATIQNNISERRQGSQYEFRFRHKDGTYRWIMAQASIVQDDSGRPVKMLGSHIDITEHKRSEKERQELQEQLNQAQKMESIGRLAGGVAHDFNNMLGIILGHAELAMEQVSPGTPLEDNLEEIRKAALRSANLTRHLLAFARKQTISPRVINLNNTITDMIKMLRRLIGEDIELLWMPGENLWPVKVDPAQTDQVIVNLCINARDAIGSGGQITINTKNCDFDPSNFRYHADCKPGQYVMLSVSDNGCGMDKQTLDNLFEPFFTTKDVGSGTGLGLAMIYGVVMQNNGCIDVQSTPGRGASFDIYLPRASEYSEEKQRPAVHPKAEGHETVMIVEDERAILHLAQSVLEKLGYKVLAANLPEQAMAIMEQQRPHIDLLVTDVVMPGMNGLQLKERIEKYLPEIKVLFMSGYPADVVSHKGILEAEGRFLHKPFTNQEFAKKVRDALDRDK